MKRLALLLHFGTVILGIVAAAHFASRGDYGIAVPLGIFALVAAAVGLLVTNPNSV